MENGNVAKSLNFKGSISVYLGLGPRDSDFLSRIILRLRSRVRLRQPGRAMETSRHSDSGADLKWMVRDCEEVKMLKTVQLCNLRNVSCEARGPDSCPEACDHGI